MIDDENKGGDSQASRILIAANSFDAVGGVETSVLPWLEEAQERSCEIDFVLCRVYGKRADLISNLGIPVCFFRLYWHVRGYQIPNPLGIWRLSRKIRMVGYDSIVCLQPPSHYFVRLAVLLSQRRPRVVAMEQLSYRDRARWYVWLDRKMAGFTSLFLCVSESLRREFLQKSGLSPETAQGIPHGISFPESEVQPDRYLAEKLKGRLVVGCIARLAEEKRQRFLVECFLRFCERSSQRPVLLLVGDEGDDPYFRKDIEQRGANEEIFVLGHREDIQSIYALLDVFVLPSVLEGFGLTWAEAMSHGIPVITSRIAPMTEFIKDGENGLLFDPDDADALVECLELLDRSGEFRSDLGKKGAEFVKARLNPLRQKRKYVDAFLGSGDMNVLISAN